MRASTSPRAALLTLAAVAACGRTELTSPPPKPPAPVCTVDADCPHHDDLCTPVHCEHTPEGDAGALVAQCVHEKPVDCNDNDPCTKDTCLPATGECSYSHVTPDEDGDGYYAPLPGFAPGSPGSCGNDCDDTNASAHPGGVEVCDGVDNDCDGIIDNGAVYLPGAPQVQVSGPIAPAGPSGLGWSGQSYAATYTGTDNGFNVYLSTLTPAGAVITPPGEETYTLVNADAEGGTLRWIGDRYGILWQDRRTGAYNIFYSSADATGRKQIADVELSFQEGFSVNPDLAWNGQEFLAVWQDDREGPFNLYAQRFAADGTLDGDNLALTTGSDQDFGNESPSIAPGLSGVGITWSFSAAQTHFVDFQVFSTDLSTALTPPINVTDGTTDAVFPTVVWNRDRYVIAWYDTSASPAAVYAATFGADGSAMAPPQPITDPGPFHSRYPFLRALGDRVLLVYADDRDQNDGYEIYTRTVESDLTPLGGELRVTNAPRDSVFPFAAFGPNGDFGILFRDDRNDGAQDVYFTSLSCYLPMMP
jgi:Putative metal-binding motif